MFDRQIDNYGMRLDSLCYYNHRNIYCQQVAVDVAVAGQ